MKKKILVISNSLLLINYIKEELENKKFRIISTNNEIIGLVKLRNEYPDLVILDYDISSMWGFKFLEEKSKLEKNKNIPLIMLYFKKDHLDRKTIIKLAKYKINRILQKPLNIDVLFKSVENIFNTKFNMDLNPCTIDINYDNDVLFIRLSKGLNKDKINLIKYKILELKKAYEIKIYKVIVSIFDIDKQNNDFNLLHIMLDNIVESTRISLTNIFIFSDNKFIKLFFLNNSKFNLLTVTNNFNEILEKIKYKNIFNNVIDFFNKDKQNVFFNSAFFNKNGEEIFKLKFSHEKEEEKLYLPNKILTSII